jgi:glutathione synthase/RimK-type ligase-like ATP-grasp enzyme
MPKIAFATYSELPYLTDNDKLLIPYFEEYGYKVTPEIWDNPSIDWQQYDLVLIRSTWDYYLKPEKFKTWVSQFIDAKTKLLNAPEIILKNSHKFYLKELKEQGINIIPTIFSSDNINLEDLKKWKKVVIKPAVSAGSHETEVFETETLTSEILDSKIKKGDWLIQPFLNEIQKAGEISMIFFNGNFSHAIQKVPKVGDFRVQKQFGAKYLKFEPSKELLLKAKNIVEISGKESNYARVDGVITQNGFLLMEIEMIEPDLFFDIYPDAAHIFCKEIVALLIQNPKE